MGSGLDPSDCSRGLSVDNLLRLLYTVTLRSISMTVTCVRLVTTNSSHCTTHTVLEERNVNFYLFRFK